MIAIPESVGFYWHDAVNRAALNVLAGSGEVPADLTWAEAERFELAQLAARRVRVEYRQLLRALWSASWEAAIREHLPRAKLLSYGGHRDFATDIDGHDTITVEGVWKERAVSGIYELPGRGQLFTRLALVEHESAVELAFYRWDGDDSTVLSDALDVRPEWADDGEGRRTSVPDALPVNGTGGSIDPEPMAKLAQSAAAVLAEALG